MGRADVLLRFLQLVGLDCPEDLQPYLDSLDSDTVNRPLVDQIVDRIIAGDGSLYEKYAQARREVGPRNPYHSPEEGRSPGYEQALGYFVSRWTDLESRVRQAAETRSTPDGISSHTWSVSLWWRLGAADLDPGARREFEYLKRFRNQVIHGVEAPPTSQLLEAGKLVEDIAQAFSKPIDSEDAYNQTAGEDG